MIINRVIQLVVCFLVLGLNNINGKEKVLLIGNSITYYNEMPQYLSQLAKRLGKNLQVSQSTYPGAHLSMHSCYLWHKNKGIDVSKPVSNEVLFQEFRVDTTQTILPSSVKIFQEHDFDKVIVQEQLNYILNEHLRKNFTKVAIKKFDSLCKEQRSCELFIAQTYMGKSFSKKCLQFNVCNQSGCNKKEYCSESFKSFEDMNKKIQSYFEELEISYFNVIPMSDLFFKIQNKYPKLKLYRKGDHPTKISSHIIACSYYYFIYNENNFSDLEGESNWENIINKELQEYYDSYTEKK